MDIQEESWDSRSGEKARYKARLVAKGFTQRERIDFNEIFSLFVKHSFIRVLLSLVAYKNLELEQMDVKTIFSTWRIGGNNLHATTLRLFGIRKGTQGVFA